MASRCPAGTLPRRDRQVSAFTLQATQEALILGGPVTITISSLRVNVTVRWQKHFHVLPCEETVISVEATAYHQAQPLLQPSRLICSHHETKILQLSLTLAPPTSLVALYYVVSSGNDRPRLILHKYRRDWEDIVIRDCFAPLEKICPVHLISDKDRASYRLALGDSSVVLAERYCQRSVAVIKIEGEDVCSVPGLQGLRTFLTTREENPGG